MPTDITRNTVTLADDAALAAWNETVENVLAHAAAAPTSLGRTLTIEPEFALGHAVKGLLVLTLARGELVAAAQDSLAMARAAMAERPISKRESAFVEALAFWLAESPRRAAFTLERVLDAHPSDALAFKIAYGIRFMLGDGPAMLQVAACAIAGTPGSSPLAGYVQGCLAFALEEAGYYGAAERAGRKAVDMAPRDVWGRHAVAHVLEMTGRADQGVEWLSDARTWSHANNFRFHIFWHLALFRLEQGDITEVLRLYDEEIRAERTDDFRDLANGASLLARLEFEGVHVGNRWHELAAIAERRIADRRLVFADLHYTVALLGAGRRDGAEMLAQTLLADVRDAPSAERRQAALAGAPAAFGLLALREGDPAEAARLLGEARPLMQSVGGSHAQRDLFEQAYIESLLRSGAHDRAAHILSERLARRGGVNAFARRRLSQIAMHSETARAALLSVAAVTPADQH